MVGVPVRFPREQGVRWEKQVLFEKLGGTGEDEEGAVA